MPRPSRASTSPAIPTAGFDDEPDAPAPAAPVENSAPIQSLPPQDVAPAPVPNVMPTDIMAAFLRLKEENEKLAALAKEALARAGKNPDNPAPPPPELATGKLLFIGTRYDEEAALHVPDLVPCPEGGGMHVCGRAGMPIVFRGTKDDPRPHAVVHRTLGDWLIANDVPKDVYGRKLAERYVWSED